VLVAFPLGIEERGKPPLGIETHKCNSLEIVIRIILPKKVKSPMNRISM